jgi:5,10-methylene-tetrahydrofolate dehydrogenase/methenyl tetrahydrofolate cyclohydrolase
VSRAPSGEWSRAPCVGTPQSEVLARKQQLIKPYHMNNKQSFQQCQTADIGVIGGDLKSQRRA